MNKIKESFKHHEEIGRRYKNLSYNDTHDINKAFRENDEEIKELKEALKDRKSIYYERGVPHQSQILICRCRKCVDFRVEKALKENK